MYLNYSNRPKSKMKRNPHRHLNFKSDIHKRLNELYISHFAYPICMINFILSVIVYVHYYTIDVLEQDQMIGSKD